MLVVHACVNISYFFKLLYSFTAVILKGCILDIDYMGVWIITDIFIDSCPWWRGKLTRFNILYTPVDHLASRI